MVVLHQILIIIISVIQQNNTKIIYFLLRIERKEQLNKFGAFYETGTHREGVIATSNKRIAFQSQTLLFTFTSPQASQFSHTIVILSVPLNSRLQQSIQFSRIIRNKEQPQNQLKFNATSLAPLSCSTVTQTLLAPKIAFVCESCTRYIELC